MSVAKKYGKTGQRTNMHDVQLNINSTSNGPKSSRHKGHFMVDSPEDF